MSNLRFKTDADPQRHRIYDWEDEWRDWQLNTLTLAECRLVVRTACKLYGLNPPRVVQHNYRGMSWCNDRVISLQAVGFRRRGGKNLAVVLHETAHYVVMKKYPLHRHDHGPTFMGVFMWLLTAAKVAPPVALRRSARYFNIRWCLKPPQKGR